MAFPLFAKILGGVVAVGAIGVPAAYGINEYVLKNKGVQENEGELEEQQKSVEQGQPKSVDTSVGGKKNTINVVCQSTIDRVAKKIKETFKNTYLEGDWTKKRDISSIFDADKGILTQQAAQLENPFKEEGTCSAIEGEFKTKVGEMVDFLKNPNLEEVKEKLREPMIKLLERVGSTSNRGY